MLRGILLTVVCSTAFAAEPQAFITVNPNSFAPGQNISNATAGAQLLAMTVILDPNSPYLFLPFVPQYSPAVYAQPVTSGCGTYVPCAPPGASSVLWYTGSSVPLSYPPPWWEYAVPTQVCFFDLSPPRCGIETQLLTQRPVLRVNFTVPTDHVTALTTYLPDGGYIESYDSAGNSLDFCLGGPPGFPAVGCSVSIEENVYGAGWSILTLSHPTADISFVIVGGGGANVTEIGQVQFDSPVSLQLAGLRTKVGGVGPGKSLANMAMFAQAFYGVGDIPSTCAQLVGFVNLVKSQTGKSIANLTALQLLSTVMAIEVALGCS